MPSIFDRLHAPSEAVIDRIYADEEGWSFAPMKRVPNGRTTADGSRSTMTGFKAVFDDPADRMEIDPSRRGDMLLTTRVSSGPVLYLRDPIGPAVIKPGDRFTRDRTEKVYEVTAVEPDGVSRRKIVLVEVDA